MIYNKDQLLLLAHRVNGTGGETANSYWGEYFKLGADITFDPDDLTLDDGQSNYEAIGGYNDRRFCGDFDGDGYTVSGIRIRKDGSGTADINQGLFGLTGSDAEIRNVHLSDARITGFVNVGGIVGTNNDGTVSGCYVTGSYITASYDYVTGTICGDNNGTLTNNYYHGCTVNGTENATNVGCNGDDIAENDGAVPFPALADATENTDVITKYNGQTIPVVLQDRTLYKDGKWNTLCLPFSLTAEQIAAHADFAGATLMTLDATQKNGFDTEDGTLYLGFKTATEIEAGVPYLVKWTSGDDISNPVFLGVTISSTGAQVVQSQTAGLETVQMVGTFSPVSVTADDKSILFLSDDNTLYYSSTDRQLRSCRAHFSVPYINGNAGAEARSFVLSFDDEEATGISLTPGASTEGEGSDCWYTIDGRKLSGKPSQRGMYINKGKKILVK